jgi:uncharacterized protein (TIGR02145 family)
MLANAVVIAVSVEATRSEYRTSRLALKLSAPEPPQNNGGNDGQAAVQRGEPGQVDISESIQRCKSFNSQTTAQMMDVEGNVYRTVQIGGRLWLAENIRTTRLSDGTPIPLVSDPIDWDALVAPAYCWYDNNRGHALKFGALYNWFAVGTGKLAPDGWHVPSKDEWTAMKKYLSDNGYNWDGTTGENKLAQAAAAQTDWISGKGPGTAGHDLAKNNRSGFTALPAGGRSLNGGFYSMGSSGSWWIAEEDAGYVRLEAHTQFLGGNAYSSKTNGVCVRLIKDS